MRTWFEPGPDPMDFMAREQRSEADVYALRTADGALVWRRVLTTGAASAAPTAPVVSGDRVYAGTGDGTLHVLAAADSTTAWQYQTGGRMLSTPIVVDDTLYIGASDGCVYALDARDGALRWRTFTSTTVSVAVEIRIHSFTVEPHQPPGEG